MSLSACCYTTVYTYAFIIKNVHLVPAIFDVQKFYTIDLMYSSLFFLYVKVIALNRGKVRQKNIFIHTDHVFFLDYYLFCLSQCCIWCKSSPLEIKWWVTVAWCLLATVGLSPCDSGFSLGTLVTSNSLNIWKVN